MSFPSRDTCEWSPRLGNLTRPDGPTPLHADNTITWSTFHRQHGQQPRDKPVHKPLNKYTRTRGLGARRARQTGPRPVPPTIDAGAARVDPDRDRRRGRMDRLVRGRAPPERRSTALATLADADPKGQLYRSWQLRELLRTLPRQPVERAEAEPKRWIGRASRCRIPEIVEPCGKIRTPRRHPHNHQARLFQRQDRSVQQQDQGHHPHGLRLPRHGQPHRHDQTQMLRTTHPPANTHPLTHENSRNLRNRYSTSASFNCFRV